MNQKQPIKRSKELQPLSREHHQGLLLSWKIRKGLDNGTPPEKIMEYAAWFYREHLVPHFEVEEKLLFPILGNEHPLIVRALEEHHQLTALFGSEASAELLRKIETELENHIRFEERILFGEIEKVASPGQLQLIATHHYNEPAFCDNDVLKFW